MHARHSWIYRSDVTDHGGVRAGEIVSVAASKGGALGSALFFGSLVKRITWLKIIPIASIRPNPGVELVWLAER